MTTEAARRAPVEPAYATATALAGLRAAVRRHEYDTVLRLHCWELAPRWLDASLRQTLHHAPPATRTLLQLLHGGDAVSRRAADAALGPDTTDAMLAASLLVADDAGVRARWRLDVVGDQLLLVDWPAARAGGVYFGEDSHFLRTVMQPRAGERALDLCTGSGVQALRCAAVARHVDAVDLNPAAVALARLNAALNQLDDRVTVHHGDLWDALPGDARWDHVTCNPPLVPVPDVTPYPLCGHGGADGLDVVRRILAALPARLTPEGRCTIIGACTGTAERAAIQTAIDETVAGTMAVSLFLLLRTTLRDWVRMLGDTVAAIYPGRTAASVVLEARARWGEAFGDTFVYTFLVAGDRAAAPSGCRVFDYSGVGQRSYWFVNRGRVAP